MYDWKAGVSNVFMDVCEFFGGFPSSGSSYTPYYVSLSITITAYLFLGVSIFFYELLGCVWLFPLTFHALTWCSTILFLPVMTSFIEMAFGCLQMNSGEPHPFYSDMLCSSTEHTTHTVLSVLFGLCFLIIALFTSMCIFYSKLPTCINGYSSVTSRLLNRVESFGLLLKVFLLILFVSGKHTSWKTPMALIMFLIGSLMTMLHVYYLEFYNDFTQALFIHKWLLLAWGGVVALFVSVLNDGMGTGMLYFIGLPLVTVSSYCLVAARYTYAASYNDRTLDGGDNYVMLARSMYRTFLHTHYRYVDYVDEDEIVAARRSVVLSKIETIMSQGYSRFPDHTRLHLFLTSYYSHLLNNSVLASRSLSALKDSEQLLDIRSRLYFDKVVLEQHDRQSRSVEVEQYIEFKARKEIADAKLSDTCRMLAMFWTELMGEYPQIDHLADYGHNARVSLQASLDNYEKLLEINSDSIPILRTLAIMNMNIIGNQRKAMEYFEQAEKIEQQIKVDMFSSRSDEIAQKLDIALDIFDDRNGVISISVDQSSLGHILESNATLRKLLGFNSATDLLGANIYAAMPSSIAEVHDDILTRFINRNTKTVSSIVGYTNLVLAIHNTSGYLLPIYANVRWSGESTLVGVITPLPSTPGHCFCMLDPFTQHIQFGTREFFSIFGISRKALHVGDLFIHNLMPEFAEDRQLDLDNESMQQMYKKMCSKTGLTALCHHQITGRRMNGIFKGSVLELPGRLVICVKIMTSAMLDEGALDSDSEDADHEHNFSSKFTKVLDEVQDDIEIVKSHATNGGILPLALSPIAGSARSQQINYLHVDVLTSTEPSIALPRKFFPANSPKLSTHGSSDQSPNIPLSAHRPLSAQHAHMDIAENITQRSGAHSAMFSGKDVEHTIFSQSVDLVTKPQESETQSQNSSQIRAHANGSFLNRRLRKAIRNDGKQTSNQLFRFQLFTVLIIFILLAISVIVFTITMITLDDMKTAIDQIHKSVKREDLLHDIVITSRMFSDGYLNPDIIIAQCYDSVHTDCSRETVSGAQARILAERAATLHDTSNAIDEYDIRNPAYKRFKHAPIIQVETLISYADGLTQFEALGYRECIFLITSYVARFVYTTQYGSTLPTGLPPYMVAREDYSFFFISANSMTTIAKASNQVTEFLLHEFNTRKEELAMIPIIVLCVTITLSILCTIFLVRPIVLRIEDSKTRVLEMFLDIPRSLRRALRKKVVDIYEIIKHDDENDTFTQKLDRAEDDKDGEYGYDSDEGVAKSTTSHGGMSRTSARSNDSDSYKDTLTRYAAKRRAKGNTSKNELNGASGRKNSVSIGKNKLSLTRASSHAHSSTRANENLEMVDLKKMDHMIHSVLNEKIEDEKVDTVKNTNSLGRRALRIFYLKFTSLILLVGLYYGLLTWKTITDLNTISEDVRLLRYSGRRSPALKRAAISAKMFITSAYDDLRAQEPANGLLRFGNFRDFALENIQEARIYQENVLFGLNGVPRLDIPSMNVVFYQDICHALTTGILEKYNVVVDDYFGKNCYSVAGGALGRGAYSLWDLVLSTAEGLLAPDSEGVLVYVIENNMPTHDPALVARIYALMTDLKALEEHQFNWLDPLLELATNIYYKHIKDLFPLIENILIIMLGCYMILVVFFYILVLLPTSKSLAIDADKVKSLMLLLPADIVANLESVQTYIVEQIQIEF